MRLKLLCSGTGMRKLMELCKARGYTKDNTILRVAKKGNLDARFRIYEKPPKPRYTFYVSKVGKTYKIDKVKTEYGDIVNGGIFPAQLNSQTNIDKFNSELRDYMKTRGTYTVIYKKRSN